MGDGAGKQEMSLNALRGRHALEILCMTVTFPLKVECDALSNSGVDVPCMIAGIGSLVFRHQSPSALPPS